MESERLQHSAAVGSRVELIFKLYDLEMLARQLILEALPRGHRGTKLALKTITVTMCSMELALEMSDLVVCLAQLGLQVLDPRERILEILNVAVKRHVQGTHRALGRVGRDLITFR